MLIFNSDSKMTRLGLIGFFICICAAHVAAVSGETNVIYEVQVRVEDCKGCGMQEERGKINLRIRAEDNDCWTGPLDNPDEDDFGRGQITSFKSHTIGECEGFDLVPWLEQDIEYVNMQVAHDGKKCNNFKDMHGFLISKYIFFQPF